MTEKAGPEGSGRKTSKFGPNELGSLKDDVQLNFAVITPDSVIATLNFFPWNIVTSLTHATIRQAIRRQNLIEQTMNEVIYCLSLDKRTQMDIKRKEGWDFTSSQRLLDCVCIYCGCAITLFTCPHCYSSSWCRPGILALCHSCQSYSSCASCLHISSSYALSSQKTQLFHRLVCFQSGFEV